MSPGDSRGIIYPCSVITGQSSGFSMLWSAIDESRLY